MNPSDLNETRPTPTPGFFRRLREDVRTFRAMMSDVQSKRYPVTPRWSIVSVIAALAYLVSPADLINDFIPVLGQLDDAGIVSLAWMLVRRDLTAYREWLAARTSGNGSDELGDEIPNE